MNLLYSDALQLKLRCACFRWRACVIVRYVGGCLSMAFCVGICETVCVLVCVFISCLWYVSVWLAWNARVKIVYQDIILFICYYIDKIILFFVWYGCRDIGFIC